jgi:hypothetical protein
MFEITEAKAIKDAQAETDSAQKLLHALVPLDYGRARGRTDGALGCRGKGVR